MALHYQSKLALLLSQKYDQDHLVGVPRKLFSSDVGAQIVSDYSIDNIRADIMRCLEKKLVLVVILHELSFF